MAENKQLLHLVFRGELKSTEAIEFKDIAKLDIVGMYPNFNEGRSAWTGKAQATVDQAQMRYFALHVHRLIDPGNDDHNGLTAQSE